MNNPFKVGDKVKENMWPGRDLHRIDVATVVQVEGLFVIVDKPSLSEYHRGSTRWHHDNLRAAIAGQDYPLPAATTKDPLAGAVARVCTPPEANSGHLPDGSSVQKHSAGPLYPCVLTFRDARLNGRVWNEDLKAHVKAKYDVGIISPRNYEPLWFSTFDRAVSVATAIKEDLQ